MHMMGQSNWLKTFSHLHIPPSKCLRGSCTMADRTITPDGHQTGDAARDRNQSAPKKPVCSLIFYPFQINPCRQRCKAGWSHLSCFIQLTPVDESAAIFSWRQTLSYAGQHQLLCDLCYKCLLI